MDKLIQRDNLVRIVALLIAFFMWVQVTGAENQVTVSSPYTIEIEYRNRPEEVYEGHVETTVRVNLQGTKGALSRVNTSQIRAWVDLSGVRLETPTRLDINVDVDAPGVHVLSLSPSTVTVVLEPQVPANLAVESQYLGAVPDEVRIDEVTFGDPEAHIWGPKSKVEQVSRVVAMIDPTKLLTTPQVGSEWVGEVALNPVDDRGRVIDEVRVEPLTTEARIRWTRTPSKEVPVKITLEGEPAPGYEILGAVVTPTHIRLKATTDQLASITEVATVPISVEGLAETFTQEVGLQIAPGVYAWVEGVTVTVNIIETPVDREVTEVPLTVRGLAATFEAELPTIDVTLHGPPSRLPEQLAPFVDATGLGVGSHRLRVMLPGLPTGVTASYPLEVDVVITEVASEGGGE